jgi:thiol:disulfide interchange protein DsbD
MINTRRFFLYLLVAGLFASGALAAPGKATWKAHLEPADARAGESAQVVVEATIEPAWHIYSTTPPEGAGPRPTSLELLPGKTLSPDGKVVQPAPHREMDAGFQKILETYPGAVAFGVPVKVSAGLSGAQQATIKVKYQACKEGMCMPPKTEEVPVSFTVAAGVARPDHQKPVTTAPKQPAGYEPPTEAAAPAAGAVAGTVADTDIKTRIAETQGRGLLAFLWLSITMGFFALLTPCVFPMVPITVSFFAKQQETSPGSGIRAAVAYCVGIIGTFTGLGLLMSLLFGAGSISKFATNPIVNVALAILFAVMAVNLFGGFEIILPGWLVEKSQSGTQRGGLVGPLLMGLTFTLTSFTCTVAFVGTLLAATTQGNVLWPVVGMLGFSTAFASPFFLLALFPQWLAKLPKSGGWLVTVKAFMGFLELAAALKFLSNADLVWNLGLITRPVFLAVWFGVAVLAGAYMVGWIKLPHDAGGKVGPIRATFGVASFIAGVFCLGAINGKSFGYFTGFLPPANYGGAAVARSGGHSQIEWAQSYEEALTRAKAEGKPIFIDFTGVTCTNCRLMEAEVFDKPEVAEEFKNFVTVQLYTDKETAESQRYQEMQLKRFGQTTLPLYVVQTADEQKLGEYSFDTSVPRFLDFLRKARSGTGSVASSQ